MALSAFSMQQSDSFPVVLTVSGTNGADISTWSFTIRISTDYTFADAGQQVHSETVSGAAVDNAASSVTFAAPVIAPGIYSYTVVADNAGAIQSLGVSTFTVENVQSLVVEDGTGVANANALISVNYYRQHVLGLGGAVSAEGSKIESAIRRASNYVAYAFTYKGTPVSAGQVFPFPMENLTDRYGQEIASNIVPNQVQAAVAEAATLEIATPGYFNETTSSDAGNVKRLRQKVDVLETETEYFGATTSTSGAHSKFSTNITDLLKGLISDDGSGTSSASTKTLLRA